jgi:hypothetical protein
MIDNIEFIKPLLTFDNEGDFYQLFVLLRKKDQVTDKANHQSVRTIKSYCITSHEYLDKRYDEIKMLCEVFKARAYIHVAKQNHNDVGMNMITEIVTRIQSGQINQKNVFDSVVGQIKTQEKRWIVDIDEKEISPLMIAHIEYACRPFTEVTFDAAGMPTGYSVGPKIEAIIPTKNGHHLITKRFDVQAFKEKYPNIDIQKKNPTLLYYPNTLNEF